MPKRAETVSGAKAGILRPTRGFSRRRALLARARGRPQGRDFPQHQVGGIRPNLNTWESALGVRTKSSESISRTKLAICPAQFLTASRSLPGWTSFTRLTRVSQYPRSERPSPPSPRGARSLAQLGIVFPATLYTVRKEWRFPPHSIGGDEAGVGKGTAWMMDTPIPEIPLQRLQRLDAADTGSLL